MSYPLDWVVHDVKYMLKDSFLLKASYSVIDVNLLETFHTNVAEEQMILLLHTEFRLICSIES